VFTRLRFGRSPGRALAVAVVWLAPGLLLSAVLTASPAISANPQSSPQPSPSSIAPAPPIPGGNEVISLLDAVISWARGVEFEGQLVREPAEVLFVSQNRARAADVLKLAFQYARAEAAALAESPIPAAGAPAAAASGKPQPTPAVADLLSHPEAVENRREQTKTEIENLQTQIGALQKQIAALPKRRRQPLQDQMSLLQNQLELAQARGEFLDAMAQFQAGSGAGKGATQAGILPQQIDELERTIPQLGDGAAEPPALGKTEEPPSGLIPHVSAWIAQREKLDKIDHRIKETAELGRSVARAADALRLNAVAIYGSARALAGEGGAEGGASPSALEARKLKFETLLSREKLLAAALLPMRETSLLLDRYQANLRDWRQDADERGDEQLYAGLTSAVGLAIVLGMVLAVGAIWRRIAFRYVADTRRRGQILQVRNAAVGVLMAIVLAFEFVSETGSIATVIGLGTAGIAVALQDVILSIAGYFRIGGRFGIRVGDWLELQGVRGEVIDIALTKLTMVELAGQGLEREPTGRLLVLPNSVVFREKFANRAYGTNLGWDEIELTVSPDCDYQLAEKRLLEAVEQVFSRYRDAARSGSREMERRFNLQLEPPRPQSRLRIASDAIRLSVRYPVDVRMRAEVTDEISRRLLESIKSEPSIRMVPPGTPAIQQAEAAPPETTGMTVESRVVQSQPSPAAAPKG
jgi:small-conductance mechanosensitive channel